MTTNEDDELALLATDKKFKRIFKKAASELEKNKDNEYKYKIHISEVVPLLRSFIFVSKRVYDEAKAEGYKEGQADTAKQIFKELEDNIIFIRGDNEDIGISRCSAKRYFTLKKKYNIEE